MSRCISRQIVKELKTKLDTLQALGMTFILWAGSLLLLGVIRAWRWIDKPHVIRIRKKTIIIGVLLLFLAYSLLFPRPPHVVYAGSKPPAPAPILPKPKQIATLPQTHLQPAQILQPIQTAPTPTPAPNGQSSTNNSTYSGTGDPSLDWIVSHESSGNPYAINPSSGACGLFQALPCSKLGCSLSDIACQIAWGKNYVISAYGSSYAAMLFWQAHNWY